MPTPEQYASGDYAEYQAGGYSTVDGALMGNSPSEWLGRWWNNISGATARNMYNSAEAAKAREWEKMMSDTAFQRQVADMHAAGINPALATAGGAHGASSPSGAVAHSAETANGGIAGIVGKIASIAVGKALLAKFTNSAMRAADNHELVSAKIQHMANQEVNSAYRAKQYGMSEDVKRRLNLNRIFAMGGDPGYDD